MPSKQSAADKLRAIHNWMDWQSEDFNDKIQSIPDIEKVYDYTNANDLEFIDKLDLPAIEVLKHHKAVNKILGYKLFYTSPKRKRVF